MILFINLSFLNVNNFFTLFYMFLTMVPTTINNFNPYKFLRQLKVFFNLIMSRLVFPYIFLLNSIFNFDITWPADYTDKLISFFTKNTVALIDHILHGACSNKYSTVREKNTTQSRSYYRTV